MLSTPDSFSTSHVSGLCRAYPIKKLIYSAVLCDVLVPPASALSSLDTSGLGTANAKDY